MEFLQNNMNEQMQKIADMQAKCFAPMQAFSALAADAGEQVMRQNHAVMGDYVEFAVKQVSVPFNPEAINETASAQVADVTAFGELLGARATEYVEMASSIAQKASEEFAAATKTA